MKPNFKAVFAFLFALILLPAFTTFAQSSNTYSTVKNGSWIDNTTWLNDDPAPVNITNKDVVEINHKVSAGNMKINNGGTLIIKGNGDLSGIDLDLNGKESKVIIEPGGSLDFYNFFFDNSNSTENIIITNRDLVPLPVTLVYFDVKRNNQSATNTTLEWITVSEKNNAYFAVEKSLNGKDFSEAGRVIGKNTVTGGKYSFEDKNVAGRAYYRLKQVDLDGTFTYSAIVVATANHKTALHGRELIFDQAFNGKLSILNLAGSVVKTYQLTNANSVELPQELKGIYMLQLENSAQVTSQKIAL